MPAVPAYRKKKDRPLICGRSCQFAQQETRFRYSPYMAIALIIFFLKFFINQYLQMSVKRFSG